MAGRVNAVPVAVLLALTIRRRVATHIQGRVACAHKVELQFFSLGFTGFGAILAPNDSDDSEAQGIHDHIRIVHIPKSVGVHFLSVTAGCLYVIGVVQEQEGRKRLCHQHLRLMAALAPMGRHARSSTAGLNGLTLYR